MAKKQVSLMALEQPEFLSLVEKPANQSSFKIIRNEDKTMAYRDRNRRIRKKRSDSGLLSIEFPYGVTQEEAEEIFDAFGLGEEYVLTQRDDGTYYAVRANSDKGVEGTPIPLGNGFTAYLDSSSVSRSDDSSTIAGVTLVGLEFDENFSTKEDVEKWLEEREIQCKDVEQVEGGFIVTRHETPQEVETRKVRIDVGVTGIVAKTKDTDVPVKVYRSVIEQSYGSWGWGHLSFASALADPTFSEASWDAIYVLRDVLENIILYSGLSLDERKTLAQNALNQFMVYISSLMDSLPNGVLVQAANNSTSDKTDVTRTKDMATDQKDKKAVRKDTTDKDVKNIDAGTGQQDNDNQNSEYVTRSELEEIVANTVKAAMEEYAKREDKNDDTNPSDKDHGNSVSRSDQDGDDTAQAIKSLGEQMEKVVTSISQVSRSVEDLKKEVDELAGETVARSDDDDDDDTGDDNSSVKRSDSPFAGMFGNLR